MARKTALGALMLACLTGLGLIILYPTFPYSGYTND